MDTFRDYRSIRAQAAIIDLSTSKQIDAILNSNSRTLTRISNFLRAEDYNFAAASRLLMLASPAQSSLAYNYGSCGNRIICSLFDVARFSFIIFCVYCLLDF